jgi:hypothetical protein
MKTWFPLLRARTAFLLAAAVLLAGIAPLFYFVALLGWQVATGVLTGSWVPLPATLAFTDHALLQTGKAAAVLAYLPQLPWDWLMKPQTLLPLHEVVSGLLGRIHVGLPFGLFGMLVIALGFLFALRQKYAIREAKRRNEDRMRRIDDYRRDGSAADPLYARREPFIGSDDIGRSTQRRVA